jgi:hypothetical protein
MAVHMHHALAVQHATQFFKARGEADRYGWRAQQIARAVIGARCKGSAARYTLPSDFARYSHLNGTPSTPFADSAKRDFEVYAVSNAIAGAGPYGISIDDHFRVPPAKRRGAWHAAMDMARQTPLLADLQRAHPLCYPRGLPYKVATHAPPF